MPVLVEIDSCFDFSDMTYINVFVRRTEMKNRIILAVLMALLILSSTACSNADSGETAPTSPYITESSVIEED